MKKVITYGTFDLFHEGHFRLLNRAKELGDYLIVGVTTESYDEGRGKLNVHENLMKRIENVKKTGLANEIIIEEYEGQKISDVQKYNIDIFVIGSDWIGKFDYLKEYCKVVYLERTKNISSTKLRQEKNGLIKVGVIGYGRIANRFISESKYVSGINIEGVFGENTKRLSSFVKLHELNFFETNLDVFLQKIDAVYIASPHLTHYAYVKHALKNGTHVLCEKPLVLSINEAKEIYAIAKEKNLVLLEAIKTAFSPAFIKLIQMAKSGIIGKIKSIDATFTKLVEGDIRELKSQELGGSVTELASYPLLAIIKIFGQNFEKVNFNSYMDDIKGVDLFTHIILKYKNAIATAKVGLGVKSEGDLVISGTEGFIYVKSPWWKTDYFEIRYEDANRNTKHFYKFEGDGLRYELAEFVNLIQNNNSVTNKLTPDDSIAIVKVINKFIDRENVELI